MIKKLVNITEFLLCVKDCGNYNHYSDCRVESNDTSVAHIGEINHYRQFFHDVYDRHTAYTEEAHERRKLISPLES